MQPGGVCENGGEVWHGVGCRKVWLRLSQFLKVTSKGMACNASITTCSKIVRCVTLIFLVASALVKGCSCACFAPLITPIVVPYIPLYKPPLRSLDYGSYSGSYCTGQMEGLGEYLHKPLA